MQGDHPFMTEREPVPVGPGADESEPGALQEAPNEGASVADIEALLFVAERPLTRQELSTVADLSADQIDGRLGDLEVQLAERGIRLVASGDRVMLATAPGAGPLIARYLGADKVRLSPAALETLAIVAYRQPATRGVIERIRGVDSGHVVRGLLHRRLVNELGRAETPGRPILYGTSIEFMERFGLTSLDDLPPLEVEIAARLADAEMEDASSAPDQEPDGEDASAAPDEEPAGVSTGATEGSDGSSETPDEAAHASRPGEIAAHDETADADG
jgi:segregation and condensation protein B